MQFPRLVRVFGILSWTAIVLAGLVSCQSTQTEEPVVGPVEYSTVVVVTREYLRPDSASWATRSAKGTVEMIHDSTTLNNSYDARIRLSKPLGSDTLHLQLWRQHMLTGMFPMGIVNGKLVKIAPTGRDTFATVILDRLSQLTTIFPDEFPDDQDSSIAKTLARILVDGSDTLFRKGLATAPKGLDTSRVRTDALIYASSLGLPLSTIASNWYLGLDSVKAKNAILDLMPRFIAFVDTEYLFPVPPVRVAKAVSLSDDMYSDSSTVFVMGVFVGKKRLIGPSFLVLKDGIDQNSHFDFGQSRAPGLASTNWNLNTDGTVTIRAFGNAAPGTYTLRVWMDDVDGNTDTSRVDFKVLARPDRTGPTLTRIVPSMDSVVKYGDSVVTIRVAASDSSGVESLTMNGRAMALVGSDYRIQDTIPGNGLWTERLIEAKDNLDNSNQIRVRFLRESIGAIKPKASLVEPADATGDTIPSTQKTRRIAWRITDPSGLGLVTIGGKTATATPADSTWSVDLDIPPTGTASTILLQALNMNGNGVIDSVKIVRRKDAKGPAITNILGTRPLLFDSTSAKFVWKVSDDLKLDSVWINGTLQSPRSDSVYGFNIASLTVGSNTLRIRAKDSTGNVSVDSQIVTRLPNEKSPVLTRLPGTADQVVAYGTDSVLVKWLASGNEQIDSVAINGRRAVNNKDTFALKIALNAGTIPVVAQAWNLSHNSTKDSITIESKLKDKDGNYYKIRLMPDGHVWTSQNLRTLPGSGTSTCALSNCEQNGALYAWSVAMGQSGTNDSALVGYTATSTPQGLCPSGWHVATTSEWNGLFRATIPAGTTDSGKVLRSATGWPDTGKAAYGNFILPTGNYLALLGRSQVGIDLSILISPVIPITPDITITPITFRTEPRAYIWTPVEADARTGSIEMFNSARSVQTTLTKTSSAGVRCIENSLRLVIKNPIELVTKPKIILLP